MGNASFNNVTISIARVHALFKRTIGSQLEDETGHSEYNGHRAVDTSNHYFTPKNGMDGGESLPLGEEVDPHGYLTKAAGGAYIHTEDNKVRYYEKGVSKGGDSL